MTILLFPMLFAVLLAAALVVIVTLLGRDKPEPEIVVPTPAPKPEPIKEHCCLVKGVLKSLADTPDKWTIEHGSVTGFSYRLISKHADTGTSVETLKEWGSMFGNTDYPPTAKIEYYECSRSEAQAVYSAIAGEQKKRSEKLFAEQKEKERLEAAPKIEYFENIGCQKVGATSVTESAIVEQDSGR